MIKKYITKISVVLLLSVVTAGCSKDAMDKINKDQNNPPTVPPRFTITDIIVSTAFNVTAGDFAMYSSVYSEQNVGIYNQMFNAETRIGEPYQSSTYNNGWNAVYTNLWELKKVIAQCSAGGAEAGNYQALGIAQILTAYNLASITDVMGDTPWTESGQPGVIYQPKLDKQESIYADVFKLLDEGIANVPKASPFTAIGSQDLLFGGSNASWIKFAYGLRARYKMRLSLRAAKYQEVIDDVDKSFSTTEKGALFAVNGTSTKNPFYQFLIDRDYFGASASLHKKLTDRNDPRDASFFQPYDEDGEIEFAPNGNPVQSQGVYGISGLLAINAPIHILSAHELQFLKAEAYIRLNNIPAAESALKAGINLAFIKVGLTTVQGDAYYIANVKPLFTANPLKEVMNQKYLSFYDDEFTEAYNDIRRLKAMGNNVIDLANTGVFPLRFTYGSSDVTTNNNVKAAYGDGQYVKTENVWWAGGTR